MLAACFVFCWFIILSHWFVYFAISLLPRCFFFFYQSNVTAFIWCWCWFIIRMQLLWFCFHFPFGSFLVRTPSILCALHVRIFSSAFEKHKLFLKTCLQSSTTLLWNVVWHWSLVQVIIKFGQHDDVYATVRQSSQPSEILSRTGLLQYCDHRVFASV